MTEMAEPVVQVEHLSLHTTAAAEARLKRRYAAERRFKIYGIVAISIAMGMLVLMLGTILSTGLPAFFQTQIRLEIVFDAAKIDPKGTRNPADFDRGAYQELVNDALYRTFPEVTGRTQRRDLRGLVSPVAGTVLAARVAEDPAILGRTAAVWLPASDPINQYAKGLVDKDSPAETRSVSDAQIDWFETLKKADAMRRAFNTPFFTNTDSNFPQIAGILGSTMGSLYTMIVTVLLAFPIGVAAATYLEEFAPKNRLTDFIEVNINNLAAVPSIVFGLLGLAVFLQFFGLPRSAPLVGGMVLALMSLPTIIIASRAALKAVPPSIREGALALGASRMQAVLHHVLPLAMPGILTGTIIAMAHALGETAPLLLIGMNAFVTEVPGGFLDSAATLPVQIYIWADRPERGFAEMTSAAILMLLVFLVLMNGTAIWLRKRFERRW